MRPINPLADWLVTFKTLIPEDQIIEAARPFYSEDMGRGSEDPVFQPNLLKGRLSSKKSWKRVNPVKRGAWTASSPPANC